MTRAVQPEPWVAGALCAQTDPDAFHPDPGQPGSAAKRVCARCDVTATCLAYALAHPEVMGVWGGTSQHERDLMRRDGAA